MVHELSSKQSGLLGFTLPREPELLLQSLKRQKVVLAEQVQQYQMRLPLLPKEEPEYASVCHSQV